PHGVDVRTDVHALGLLLFRVLAGRDPRSTDLALPLLMAAITEQDLPAPSSIDGAIDADLDAIVSKATAKEPDRRYASAGDLVRDLDRHLAGVPVEARGRDRWYVLRNAVRRHRVLVTAAAIVFVALVAATVVSTAFWRRAEDRKDDAVRAAGIAIEEAAKSDEVVRLLRKALESGRVLRDGKPVTMTEVLDGAAKDLEAHLPRFPRAQATLRAPFGVT